MAVDIKNFFPKYPNIQKESQNLLNPYNDDFYESIYKKKEFYDERLEKTETFPMYSGTLMKNQKIISRFLSSHTQYNELLLFHEMGCVSPETKILLHDRTVKRADEIQIGDKLIGDDGNPRNVLGLVDGFSDMFRVTQEYGDSYTVNGEHILLLKITNQFVSKWENNCWFIKWFDKKNLVFKAITRRCTEENKYSEYEKLCEFKCNSDILEIKVLDYISLCYKYPYISNNLFGYTYADDGETLLSKINVEFSHVGKFVGWQIDGNKRFLLHDNTVTHNTGKTCSAIGAIEQIKGENNNITGAIIISKPGILYNFQNELLFKCTNGQYIPTRKDMIEAYILTTITDKDREIYDALSPKDKSDWMRSEVAQFDYSSLTKDEKNRWRDEAIKSYDKLTDRERAHRIKKSIRHFYTLEKFETFASELSKMRDSDITARFSNKIIVLDEIHNIRIQKGKKTKVQIYREYHRLLHLVKDCKILLMSGTPMKDSPEEISSIMNLILPLDEQLPEGDDFVTEFFSIKKGLISIKNNTKLSELKSKFKGRISYLKSMQSDVEKKIMGEKIGKLKNFKVVVDKMGEFQSRHYKQIYEKPGDDEGIRQAFGTKSRQASLFIFPDGSTGEKGFDKYVIKSKGRSITDLEGKKVKIYSYSIKKDLSDKILADSKAQMLTNLGKYSSKYKATIKNILSDNNRNKSGFVYSAYVKGSGSILFASILELFGFSKANGDEKSKKLRYALINNETSNHKEIRKIIDRFNRPDNMNGEYIKVIIGSQVIGEGFTLKNVQFIDILTGHWNYSETAQVIARGWRLGSHKDLLDKGRSVDVDIYQRVSIPRKIDKVPSINLELYETSEIKDINIKYIERFIKEAAVDCALFYKRNNVTGYDNERECDYQDCDYVCDGIPMDLIEKGIDNKDLDYSTFQLYYSDPNKEKIKQEIINLFRTTFRLDLNFIISKFSMYTGFELIDTLRTMINESTLIINKYGFPSYLREENNIFFLVESLSVSQNFFSEYYTKNPNIKKQETFTHVVNSMYFSTYIPHIIDKIKVADNILDIKELMLKLPLEIQEYFIESSILARELDVNVPIRDLILEHFKHFYAKIAGVWMSWLLYDEEDILKCLIPDNKGDLTWKKCSVEYKEKYEQERNKKKVTLENNKYGFYGIYDQNAEDNKNPGVLVDHFYIRDVTQELNPKKKTKIYKGKVCDTWQKNDLLNLVLKVFNIPAPKDYLPDKSKKDLWDIAIKNKRFKTDKKYALFPDAVYETFSIEKIIQFLYWDSLKTKNICPKIQEWMAENNLLHYGKKEK